MWREWMFVCENVQNRGAGSGCLFARTCRTVGQGRGSDCRHITKVGERSLARSVVAVGGPVPNNNRR